MGNKYNWNGERFLHVKRRLKFSYEEIAYKAGVSAETVRNLVKNVHSPRGDNLLAIADVMGVDPRFFYDAVVEIQQTKEQENGTENIVTD